MLVPYPVAGTEVLLVIWGRLAGEIFWASIHGATRQRALAKVDRWRHEGRD